MKYFILKQPVRAGKITAIEGNEVVLDGNKKNSTHLSDQIIASQSPRVGAYLFEDGTIMGAPEFESLYTTKINPKKTLKAPDPTETGAGEGLVK